MLFKSTNTHTSTHTYICTNKTNCHNKVIPGSGRGNVILCKWKLLRRAEIKVCLRKNASGWLKTLAKGSLVWSFVFVAAYKDHFNSKGFLCDDRLWTHLPYYSGQDKCLEVTLGRNIRSWRKYTSFKKQQLCSSAWSHRPMEPLSQEKFTSTHTLVAIVKISAETGFERVSEQAYHRIGDSIIVCVLFVGSWMLLRWLFSGDGDHQNLVYRALTWLLMSHAQVHRKVLPRSITRQKSSWNIGHEKTFGGKGAAFAHIGQQAQLWDHLSAVLLAADESVNFIRKTCLEVSEDCSSCRKGDGHRFLEFTNCELWILWHLEIHCYFAKVNWPWPLTWPRVNCLSVQLTILTYIRIYLYVYVRIYKISSEKSKNPA